jgi:hypothetical protein
MGLACPLAIHLLTPSLKLVLSLKIGLPRLEAFHLLLNVGGFVAGAKSGSMRLVLLLSVWSPSM